MFIVDSFLKSSSHISFRWRNFRCENAHKTQATACRVENQEVIQHCTQSLLPPGKRTQCLALVSPPKQALEGYNLLNLEAESPNLMNLCRRGSLYTLNAQSPEAEWEKNADKLRKSVSTFSITSKAPPPSKGSSPY